MDIYSSFDVNDRMKEKKTCRTLQSHLPNNRATEAMIKKGRRERAYGGRN